MARKIKPTTFRTGITKPWQSRWFFKRSNNFLIEEDFIIRRIIRDKILQSGIAAIEIERTGESVVRVIIKAARPGLIIGRGGKGIEELKDAILKSLKKLRRSKKMVGGVILNLNVEELRRTEVSAPVVAQMIASDIERRMPYRMIMKRQIESLKQSHEIKGAKIRLSGRLNGSEISRRDWLAFGRMPLQTLRADIDYGEATSFNSYGTIGVKVWIYKGEIFAD